MPSSAIHKIKPGVYWFTGLPGAGKTTLAHELARLLKQSGNAVEILDGDEVRKVFADTGFDRTSRNDHIKRVGYAAHLLEKHGVIVLAAFVSPYAEARQFVRNLSDNFVEIYLSAPIEICEKRDPKKLYEKARKGLIHNFTGVSDPYEKPTAPEITIDTSKKDIQQSVKTIIDYMRSQ